MDSADIFFLVAITGLSLIFGSFFSMVVYRLRMNQSGGLGGRSHCPTCGHALSAVDLVPVFSWIFSRGKCRHCGAAVSATYPLMEATTAIITVVASVGLAASYEIPLSALPSFGAWWWMMGMLFLLVPVAWHDLRYLEIPDEILRPATLALLFLHVGAFAFAWQVPFFTEASDIYWFTFFGQNSLTEWLVSSLIIFLFFALQIILPGALWTISRKRWKLLGELFVSILVFPLWMLSLYEITKRADLVAAASSEEDTLPAWMGWGDLRLALFLGLAGGMWALVGVAMAYVIGSVFGILWLAGGRSSVVPFGPFLALWFILALSWGSVIL